MFKFEVLCICVGLDIEIEVFWICSLIYIEFLYVFCDVIFCKVCVGVYVVF